MHRILLLVVFLCVGLQVGAQCPEVNTAFQSNERLEYKLFFNWKFIWINAGTATLSTKSTRYHNKKAFTSYLITRTSKRLDRFFQMRDTLIATVTEDLVPLYYRKGAHEGGQYRMNEVRYSYSDGKCHIDLLYQNPSGERTKHVVEQAECAYDMLSMMLRARSFDAKDFKVGQRVDFKMADGRSVDTQTIVYRGIKNFTTEDDEKITYRCMVFSFVEKNGKKEKEIITFYITDDMNHLPVRLDMFLRFGVAKAYLKTAFGVRNEQTSIIKQKS